MSSPPPSPAAEAFLRALGPPAPASAAEARAVHVSNVTALVAQMKTWLGPIVEAGQLTIKDATVDLKDDSSTYAVPAASLVFTAGTIVIRPRATVAGPPRVCLETGSPGRVVRATFRVVDGAWVLAQQHSSGPDHRLDPELDEIVFFEQIAALLGLEPAPKS